MSKELDEVRHKLEQVAEEFGDNSYSWCWDDTRMHLLIRDGDGNRVATLHVESVQ